MNEKKLEYPAFLSKNYPEKLSLLRQSLWRKAKLEPKFKFYSLRGLLLREDVIRAAWKRVRANKGAPGVDGIRFKDIEKQPDGIEVFLKEILQSLKEKTYKPKPVKRVYIEKANGKLRPLGIPVIRDRVVQMAVVLLLEPIFEADFLDCSHGFRPSRSAHQALDKIHQNLKEGFTEVYDADLQGYFDSIPHDNLMKCLKVRIADRQILKLIQMWLIVPVKEEGKGKPKWSKPDKGTPQGGVISPLLANIYLHWFDKVFHELGPKAWANARLVRYADDFVIMARYIGPRIIAFVERYIEKRFSLKINKEKTSIINLNEPKTSLDFLGYTYQKHKDLFGKETTYWNMFPSKKSVKKERLKLKEMTGSKTCFLPVKTMIHDINKHRLSWKNYFSAGYPKAVNRALNHYTMTRILKHLRRRSQRAYKIPEGITTYRHLLNLGVIQL